MARGWESKAVEDQMEEAARDQIERQSGSRAPDNFERQQKREGLRLTRSNLVQQLSRARTVTHRQMIHEALREIDKQLAALDSKSEI
jgi:hypothetical protein